MLGTEVKHTKVCTYSQIVKSCPVDPQGHFPFVESFLPNYQCFSHLTTNYGVYSNLFLVWYLLNVVKRCQQQASLR